LATAEGGGLPEGCRITVADDAVDLVHLKFSVELLPLLSTTLPFLGLDLLELLL